MNGLHYSIRPDKSYFMTLTVVDWIDVFSRANHKMLLIDSLKLGIIIKLSILNFGRMEIMLLKYIVKK